MATGARVTVDENLIVALIKSGHTILNCIYADGTTHFLVDELERRDREFLEAHKEADVNGWIKTKNCYGEPFTTFLISLAE